MTVGKPIAVWNVISESARLIMKYPATILIQVIPAVPSLLGGIFFGSTVFSGLGFLATFAAVILGILASGAYVPIVKAELTNQPWTLAEGFSKGYQRFWAILAAGILVGIIVVLGFIALIVPGIVFLCWFVYTVPAIVSEDKGALEGMSASRAFGRDKKWSTFLMFLTFIVFNIILLIITGLVSGTAGSVLNSILTIPLDAWFSVTIVYTYLTHGPAQLSPNAPGPTSMPASPVAASGGQFCPNCGTALQPGAKFCPNCGAAV